MCRHQIFGLNDFGVVRLPVTDPYFGKLPDDPRCGNGLACRGVKERLALISGSPLRSVQKHLRRKSGE